MGYDLEISAGKAKKGRNKQEESVKGQKLIPRRFERDILTRRKERYTNNEKPDRLSSSENQRS